MHSARCEDVPKSIRAGITPLRRVRHRADTGAIKNDQCDSVEHRHQQPPSKTVILSKSLFVCVKIWIQRRRWLSDATNYGGEPGGEVISAEPNAGGLTAARGGEAGCAGVGPAGGEVALIRSGGGGGVGRFIGDAAESALAF